MSSVLALVPLFILVAVTGYPTKIEELESQASLRENPGTLKTHYLPVDVQQQSTELSIIKTTRLINSSKSLGLSITPVEHKAEIEPIAEGQHFFPSLSAIFHPQLSHLRPPLYPEPLYDSTPTFKPHDSLRFSSGNFKDYSAPLTTAESERSVNLLGSGNFGVLRGGTYYPRENEDLLNEDIYNNYYRGNIDHSHQSLYPPNTLPKFKFGMDFFANFKDFAEISSPTKASYSEYYIVYSNPNTTKLNAHHKTHAYSLSKSNLDQLHIHNKNKHINYVHTKYAMKPKVKAFDSSFKFTYRIKKETPDGVYDNLLATS